MTILEKIAKGLQEITPLDHRRMAENSMMWKNNSSAMARYMETWFLALINTETPEGVEPQRALDLLHRLVYNQYISNSLTIDERVNALIAMICRYGKEVPSDMTDLEFAQEIEGFAIRNLETQSEALLSKAREEFYAEKMFGMKHPSQISYYSCPKHPERVDVIRYTTSMDEESGLYVAEPPIAITGGHKPGQILCATCGAKMIPVTDEGYEKWLSNLNDLAQES